MGRDHARQAHERRQHALVNAGGDSSGSSYPGGGLHRRSALATRTAVIWPVRRSGRRIVPLMVLHEAIINPIVHTKDYERGHRQARPSRVGETALDHPGEGPWCILTAAVNPKPNSRINKFTGPWQGCVAGAQRC
jgi:hypothetical protein